MAGGVGSRFWPYSRNARPKQFLDFLGTGQSLLQMTFNRFSQLIPAENILIVTNSAYKELILQQLPLIAPEQILLEPERRNTAPCIAYALHRIKTVAPDASIVVAPSDHLILNEKEFLRVIGAGLDFVSDKDALLTIGISPTRPETGYGYIQMENKDNDYCKVKRFTEKPTAEKAAEFIASGDFLWNAGIFLWSVAAIDRAMKLYLPEINALMEEGKDCWGNADEQDFINRVFPLCPNVSIDYGILEKADNVYVQGAEFGWSDLGTWDSLYGLLPKDEKGNALQYNNALMYESNNNLVVLPEGKIAIIDGLDGILVAESGNVLLICKKEAESKIRQFVSDTAERFGSENV